MNNCPRCQAIIPNVRNISGGYVYDYQNCKCGLTINRKTQSMSTHSFIVKYDCLLWMLKDNCTYYINCGKEIKLPWLPFNITPERLKTLLVFS
jgi:hypothetical protein